MASEGMQLAVTLLLFVGLGVWLDGKKNSSPWFTLAGSFVGIVVGLYGFLRKFIKKS